MEHPADSAPATAGVAPRSSIIEAQALAHPSRQRIAEALAASDEGMTAFELADAVGLHHNAVRQHLARLARAGAVASERHAVPGRRGRPSIRYRLVAKDSLAQAGHRELVRLLLNLARRAGASERDVEDLGREEGRLLARRDGGRPALLGAFARLGFAPDEVTDRTARRAGELDVRLRRCPFADAVLAEGGRLICDLHRGLTLGVLDAAAEDANLTAFEPRDPITAGCRVAARGLPAGAYRSRRTSTLWSLVPLRLVSAPESPRRSRLSRLVRSSLPSRLWSALATETARVGAAGEWFAAAAMPAPAPATESTAAPAMTDVSSRRLLVVIGFIVSLLLTSWVVRSSSSRKVRLG
jgi:predicted ArsR family transcriptional regulator